MTTEQLTDATGGSTAGDPGPAGVKAGASPTGVNPVGATPTGATTASSRRAYERRQRRHQVQQREIEALAGRDAPASVIALPRARHVLGTLGGMKRVKTVLAG